MFVARLIIQGHDLPAENGPGAIIEADHRAGAPVNQVVLHGSEIDEGDLAVVLAQIHHEHAFHIIQILQILLGKLDGKALIPIRDLVLLDVHLPAVGLRFLIPEKAAAESGKGHEGFPAEGGI